MMRHCRKSCFGAAPILAVTTVVFALMPTTTLAQTPAEGEIPARLRDFEGTVSIQRAAVGTTESALNNLPVSKGDRVWTEADGRAEVVFNDGSTIWLDHSTTIDVISLRPRLRDPEAILRLWSGSLYLERPIPAAGSSLKELRIDSGAGSALIEGAGLYRIDVDDEQRVWLSVYDGVADLLASGMIESVGTGQQTYAELDSAPAHAIAFNTAEEDDFAAWRGQLLSQNAPTERYVREVSAYVPREIVHHVYDLEGYGSWVYYDAYGSWGWRPSVVVGWSPYRHGRWVYSWSGWVWVPFARWGYVTAHYGRWDYVGSYGWCWFPGRKWGPAWVQWYVSPHHVGWAPLNYYNQPVVNINVYGDVYGGIHVGGRYPTAGIGGHRAAIGPQGSLSGTGKVVNGLGYTAGKARAWTFVESGQFGSADVDRVALDTTAAAAVARSGNSSRAMIAGPLRARTPSNVTPPPRTERVAVARGSVLDRPGEGMAASTPGTALRTLGSRANPGAVAGARPQSPMARSGAVSRQATPSGTRAAGSSDSPSGAGRAPGQAGYRSAAPRPQGQTVAPRPGGVTSSSARTRSNPPASTRPPSMSRPVVPRRAPETRPSSPGAGSSRASIPRYQSVPSRSPTVGRPTTSPRSTSVPLPRTSGGSTAIRRPSSTPAPGSVARSSIRPPSGGGRVITPRGSSVTRPSVPRPSAGARPPASGSAKPSGGGVKPPRKAKPKGD